MSLGLWCVLFYFGEYLLLVDHRLWRRQMDRGLEVVFYD